MRNVWVGAVWFKRIIPLRFCKWRSSKHATGCALSGKLGINHRCEYLDHPQSHDKGITFWKGWSFAQSNTFLCIARISVHLPAFGSSPSKPFRSMHLSKCLKFYYCPCSNHFPWHLVPCIHHLLCPNVGPRVPIKSFPVHLKTILSGFWYPNPGQRTRHSPYLFPSCFYAAL